MTFMLAILFIACQDSWDDLFNPTVESTPSIRANANISVYLNSGQAGGTLVSTCRIYQNSTYIGSASHYLQINP